MVDKFIGAGMCFMILREHSGKCAIVVGVECVVHSIVRGTTVFGNQSTQFEEKRAEAFGAPPSTDRAPIF